MQLHAKAANGGRTALLASLLRQLITLSILLVCVNGALQQRTHKAAGTHRRSNKPLLDVDAKRELIISSEKSLWDYLNKAGTNKNSLLKKVYDTHRLQLDPQLIDNQPFNNVQCAFASFYYM